MKKCVSWSAGYRLSVLFSEAPRLRKLPCCVAYLLAFLCFATTQGFSQGDVLTHRYDGTRVGANTGETALTLSNVNTSNFGKLFSLAVDGQVYAQPLYKANVFIPGQGVHNVLFIATEHDSVYCFDADGQSAQPLWQKSFINPAASITTVPSSDYSGTDLVPEVGITSTPVIDPTTNVMYVVAKTKEVIGGTAHYYYRLHALDITTGAEMPNSPSAPFNPSVPGSGTPNKNGSVVLDSEYSLQRPGLALVANNVYAALGSADDFGQWNGWVLAFDKTTLLAGAIFVGAPNGNGSGIWMNGNGLPFDSAGYIYASTANGSFDGISNFGDSYLKLSTTGGLTLTDYFTPYDQAQLDSGNLDVASGGLILLPDSAGTLAHPQIMIGCTKNGTVYVIDRANLGHFNSNNNNQIIQTLTGQVGTGCFSTPTYWNGRVYIGGNGAPAHLFSFSNGQLSSSPASQTSVSFGYPGGSGTVSSNGTSNAIYWVIQRSSGNAILHAYDATNLATELYNSTQVAGDAAGTAVKFAVPVVTNGKVYIGTQSSVVVYGLKAASNQAAAPVITPPGGTYAAPISVTMADATQGATIYYTTDGSTPTPASTPYTGAFTVSQNTTVRAMAVASGYLNSSISSAIYTFASQVPITFQQANFTTPQTAQSTVSLPFTTAQFLGDLNVIVVGWNDSTAQVTSVTDTNGNVYTRAIGPTVYTGAATQSIYYAKNITGTTGTNTVTVQFNVAAQYVDLRIAEYRGIDTTNPLDVAIAATGSSATSATGTVTTTNANDLLIGANLVLTGTTGAGSGWTQRLLTTPDGDILEDRIVTATGSYTATAPLTGSGPWIMQLVAFRAAGSGTPTVATPTFTPAGGTYSSPQNVTVSDTTAGSTIYYTTDGSTPTTSSLVYSNPIPVNTTTTLKALAVANGYTNSAVATATYTINLTVATPTFTPAPGTYSNPQNVTISDTTTGSTIYYTTDGSTPTTSSLVYSNPITVNVSTTLKAMAVANGYTNSAVATATYTINLTVATPTFTPAPGTYSSPQNVTISDTTTGSTIYYTTDGSTPTTSSLVYNNPITVSVSTTLKAMAAAPGYTNSAVAVGTYTIGVVTNQIGYVQGAYSAPQKAQTTVTANYPAVQSAGNLNVVVVGWNDSSAQVTSVTDTSGNVYTRAIGPTVYPGTATQSIYYAKNITSVAAGTNTVTVQFNVAAQYVDLRIAEYRGIDTTNPLEGAIAATGSNATSATGAVTTTYANDLLVAANLVQTATRGSGTGYTQRLLSRPDADILEDRIVTATGSYTATATLNAAGPWIMQLVAFRSK